MILYTCQEENKKRKGLIIMKKEIKVIENLMLDMVKNYGISPEYATKIILERITTETINRLGA